MTRSEARVGLFVILFSVGIVVFGVQAFLWARDILADYIQSRTIANCLMLGACLAIVCAGGKAATARK